MLKQKQNPINDQVQFHTRVHYPGQYFAWLNGQLPATCYGWNGHRWSVVQLAVKNVLLFPHHMGIGAIDRDTCISAHHQATVRGHSQTVTEVSLNNSAVTYDNSSLRLRLSNVITFGHSWSFLLLKETILSLDYRG